MAFQNKNNSATKRFKIACLILAHKNPIQLSTLVSLLNHPAIDIFIHIDKRSDIAEFTSVVTGPNVYFIHRRVKSKWGGFGLVEAVINGLTQISETNKYSYVNLLSGQDLPIRPLDEFVLHLQNTNGINYIDTEPMDLSDSWWIENQVRFSKYNLVNWSLPGKYRIEKVLNYFISNRKCPYGFTIAGKSQWFCISDEAVTFILKQVTGLKKYSRFFKYVWGSDEFFFSTLLYNSKFQKTNRESLTFVKWSKDSKLHPIFLSNDHIMEIINSKKFFARKFDLSIDENIIDYFSSRVKN